MWGRFAGGRCEQIRKLSVQPGAASPLAVCLQYSTPAGFVVAIPRGGEEHVFASKSSRLWARPRTPRRTRYPADDDEDVLLYRSRRVSAGCIAT